MRPCTPTDRTGWYGMAGGEDRPAGSTPNDEAAEDAARKGLRE